MKQDFEMIKANFGRDVDYVNVYGIADLHIGSQNVDLKSWERWKNMVMADDNGVVVLVGDMGDFSLKNSIGNSYDATMSPAKQKEWLKNELEPMKDKIIGGIKGNHEYRVDYAVGECPLYDVMCKLDIEDRYRPNMGFVKIKLGSKSKDRQFAYSLVLAHGQSRKKTSDFGYVIDGVDVFFTGHTHCPSDEFQSKIVFDTHNEFVSMRDFTHITLPSFQSLGGYALKGLYLPQSSRKFPIVRLSGVEKDIQVMWV